MRVMSLGVMLAGATLTVSAGADELPCHLGSSSSLYTDNGFGETPEADDHLGSALAKGDFDGDGFEDLAMSTPDEDLGAQADAGLVHVVFGGLSTAPQRKQTLRQADLPGEQTFANAAFGATLAVGDFNGDGYDDLAVTAQKSGGGVGRYFVIPGFGTGLDAAHATFIPNQTVASRNSPMAAGDFDLDGRDDIALGQSWYAGSCPISAGARGRVVFAYGVSGALLQFARIISTNDSTSGVQCGGKFGSALYVTSLQGRRVVLAGQPYYDLPNAPDSLDVGSYFRFGFGESGRPEVLQFAHAAQAGARYGSSFTSGDFDGDGQRDYAVGAPGNATNAGWVRIGYAHGGTQLLRHEDFRPTPPPPSGEFGTALASGNLDGDGIDDLVIGAPFAWANDGDILIARGAAAGLNPIYTMIFVMPTASAWREFGRVMLTMDRDNDGRAELVSGIPMARLYGLPEAALWSGVVASTRFKQLDQCQ
ncbi:MAG: FG-GAP repeat protein [Steroidobacter sp.]